MLNTPSPDTSFERVHQCQPWPGSLAARQPQERWELHTHAPTSHMNLFVYVNADGASISMQPEDAKALRDALIEAYPINQQPEPQPSAEYKAVRDFSFMNGWSVVREELKPYAITKATCTDEETAKQIAQALNEVEGL
jgi:hypothetical protein